jgi:hypothetical protein
MGTAALDLDRTFTVNIHDAVPGCPTRSTPIFRNDALRMSLPLTLVEHHHPLSLIVRRPVSQAHSSTRKERVNRHPGTCRQLHPSGPT